MQYISSKENAYIKEIKKLNNRKYRDLNNKFIIEGYRFVKEAFVSNASIESILISSNFISKYEDIISLCEEKNVLIYEIADNIFKELCNTENPQGIMGLINREITSISFEDGVYVLLDKLQDPGNVGTIIRTSHAAGVKGIICTKGTVDPYNDKVLRSTMGSIFYIPIVFDNDLTKITALKEKKFELLVTSLEDCVDLYDCNLKNNLIIAIGNEGNGISDEIFNLASKRIKIPMPGGAESLNAGVAGSIIIYETLRQRSSCNL